MLTTTQKELELGCQDDNCSFRTRRDFQTSPRAQGQEGAGGAPPGPQGRAPIESHSTGSAVGSGPPRPGISVFIGTT